MMEPSALEMAASYTSEVMYGVVYAALAVLPAD